MEYIDVHTAAEKWSLKERRVTALCRSGRITGAIKQGKNWLIPACAQKPSDARRTAASLMDAFSSNIRTPLPIGVSDFRETVTNYYYVDKTLFIKEFLDTLPKVSLFTRPRRFGKTLTMDMLRTFFEKTEEDTSIYFKNKKIWACGEKYRKHQRRYPVIFITFKDLKYNTWEETLTNLQALITKEYLRHEEILTSDRCNDFDRKYCRELMDGSLAPAMLPNAIAYLAEMLEKHWDTAPIIIIDEYDTPIQHGFTRGYYDQVIDFMRNFFSAAFKDSRHLSYGFLTGILRVAKESIFSGMNNLKVYSILDERFSGYFGFSEEEVLEMLQYYGSPEKYGEICEWYDGYHFGDTDIFNPWSVLNYLDDCCHPKAFWQATGNNNIIRQIVADSSAEIRDNLQLLMQGKTISAYIDTSVIYPEIQNDPSSVYSFLLTAGYLKITSQEERREENAFCELAIPNREIFYVYEKEILSALPDIFRQSTAIAIQKAILRQDIPELQNQLKAFLRQTISIYDESQESFYQGLMLGLYAIMNNRYQVNSNRESGDGRYDIQMMPLNKTLPGILVELKVLGKKDGKDENNITGKLKALSEKALSQIDRMDYAASMRENGITQIMKLGIAFYKKQAEISYSFYRI
ncbi:MAG: ATP-binding protein [Lachnospiraceae bacterium]|nr:ATP-binding protein [Lachnospiraceae bacterium]